DDRPDQCFGYPASVTARPQGFAEILPRYTLHIVEHGRILESHFFKHGSPVMQNVLQVFDARLAYTDFHHSDIVGGSLRVVGTKWFGVKMLDAAFSWKDLAAWSDNDPSGRPS